VRPRIYFSLIVRNEDVLGNTATSFLQGFYPPSEPATAAILTNGSAQFNPLDGYQYVLVNGLPSTAPDSIWIKGDMYCPAMTNASKAYYQSTEFLNRQSELQSFYDKFTPLLVGIFPQSEIGFQSAYGIFDYLNVGYVHNQTIFTNLSTDDLFQLRTLADEQELALVYNVSSPDTSIGGKTLSGAILSQLNKTVAQTDKNLKITYFAASYSVFQAFFGLSGLLDADADFYGLPDYASTMSFELRLPVNSVGTHGLFVRYGFRNGSLPSAELNTFPLFGRTQIEADIPWNQFALGMSVQIISNQADWCHACVSSNLTFCAAYPSGSTSGVSPVSAGYIGAGVTIAVIAGIEALVTVWWFARKRRSNNVATQKGIDYE
jgi:prostatic aicd phosphatase